MLTSELRLLHADMPILITADAQDLPALTEALESDRCAADREALHRHQAA